MNIIEKRKKSQNTRNINNSIKAIRNDSLPPARNYKGLNTFTRIGSTKSDYNTVRDWAKNTLEEYNVTSIKNIKSIPDIVTRTTLKYFLNAVSIESSRQRPAELEFIKRMKAANADFTMLPTSGHQALYVIGGGILFGSEIDAGIDLPKSVDSVETIKNRQIYYFLKYIKNNGGAQDSEFNSVIRQMIEVGNYLHNNDDTDSEFIFVLDGDYFTEEKRSYISGFIVDGISISSVEDI